MYDQRPVVVNMDEVFRRGMPQSPEEAESNLSPEAMRDHRPRARGNDAFAPGGAVSFIPMLQQTQAGEDREEDSERSSRSSWLSPMDFLDDEDLYGRDGNPDDAEDRNADDPVILDWEGLREHLAEQEMGDMNVEDADQNSEEEREGSQISLMRDRDLRSMALEPVQVGSTSAGDRGGDQGNTLRPTNVNGGNNVSDPTGTLLSSMDSAMRMGGQPPVRNGRNMEEDDLPEINLQGTRATMEESTARWNTAPSPPTNSASAFRAPSVSSPPNPGLSSGWESSRRDPVRPAENISAIAPSIRMEPMQPSSSISSPVNRPAVRETSPAQRVPIDRSHFRDEDFRLRPGSSRF